MNARLALATLGCSALWHFGCGESPSADAGRLDAPTSFESGTADAGSDAGSVGTLADYCVPLAEGLCTRASDCGCGVVLPGGTLDIAACTERWRAECEAAWGPFVAAGARVDPARAAACVETIGAASPSCGAPSGVAAFALCEPFVIDAAALGEPCASPYCADGAGVCRMTGEGRGTCEPRVAASGRCDDMFSCETGSACVEGSCQGLASEGEACTSDLACLPPLLCLGDTCRPRAAVGGACEDTRGCERGLVCQGGVCATRAGSGCDESRPCGSLEGCAAPPSCRAPLAEGEACRDNADCAPALYCADATHTCVARPTDGTACGNGVICAAGLGCDLDGAGTCRALGGMGAPCLFGEFGPFLCAAGLACTEGACGPIPGEGQACAGTDTCAEGLGCAFGPTGSICVVPRGEGEACENRQACRVELHCGATGTCTADVPEGAPCDPGLGDCGGACVPDASGGFVCRARLAEGATCLDDLDCASGLTCLVRAEDTRCLAEVCGSL